MSPFGWMGDGVFEDEQSGATAIELAGSSEAWRVETQKSDRTDGRELPAGQAGLEAVSPAWRRRLDSSVTRARQRESATQSLQKENAGALHDRLRGFRPDLGGGKAGRRRNGGRAGDTAAMASG